MKEEDLYNNDYFNFEKLRLDESRFRIATDTERMIIDLGLKTAIEKKAIGVLANSGYGCKTAIKKLVTQFNGIHYLLEPLKNEPFINLLQQILYMELPPAVVNLKQSKPRDLIESISYLFKNVKSARKRLIILYNVHNLRKSDLTNFAMLCNKLKNEVGIMFTIDESFYYTLCKKSENDRSIVDFLESFRSLKIQGPQPEEFEKLCIQRGILARKVISSLIKGVTDFKSLNRKIDDLKEFLRRKGRL